MSTSLTRADKQPEGLPIASQELAGEIDVHSAAMFTRVPTGSAAPDRRRPISIILGIVTAIYLVLTAAGSLWTDFLWFDSIGYESVWLKNWGMSILLGAIGVVVAFGVIWISLRLADRFSPRWVPFDLTEEEELIERFREWVEPRLRQVRLIVSGVLALLLGLAASAWRDEFFLFQNGEDFGVTDPIFGSDLSLYMFQLPFFNTVLDWLFNLFLLTLVVVLVVHYFNGGIRLSGRGFNVTDGTKTHILIMLAILALIRAVIYRLDMYGLLLSGRSEPAFFGPGFTDVNARLPALRLLIAVALVAAVIFVVNIWRRGWTLSIVTVISWLVVAIAAGTIYPTVIQRFQVAPQQLDKDREFIAHNLEFTTMAYGLDEVEVRDFAASDDLDADGIEANRLIIDNLRLWDTSVLPRTYQNFQELRPYYSLSRVDTDRYVDDSGNPTQVMLSVRELEETALPREDWQNQRLFYTHGLGAVVNEANVVESNGQPRFLLKDVPPQAEVAGLELQEPRVYFGETYTEGRPVYVKTGTSPQEVDVPLPGEGTDYNEYQGDAGVILDNIFKKIAFALRYRDLNLLISGEIRPDSAVLVERNVMSIAQNVAPFLLPDTDPYPVIVNGRILWVLDLYTVSSMYPYSSPLEIQDVARLDRSTDVSLGTNYIRNSVKAVVDAYQGDITFYLADEADPLVAAWARTYDGLFAPMSEMPEGLEEHLRYPQDLFRMQTEIYLEYHVASESELITGNDAWSLPVDPSTITRNEQGGINLLIGDRFTAENTFNPIDDILPYYVLTKLPGEDDLSYLLLQPFTPASKKNMSSFLVADSTPGRYGRLIDYRMPQGELVDGTEQVGQRIEQDADISQQFTLWDSQGSQVIKGDLLVIPIEESLLYIQPIFLQAEGGGFPEFRRVAVVFGERVEWADTLDGALSLVFGTATEGDGDPIPDGETIEELVLQASSAFANAEAALAAGDLAGYQRWVEEAERLVGEIEAILEGAATP